MADVLRRQVLHGLVGDGLLPSETALADEFGFSRNTVREALDLLREEGLVERVPGVGTVVAGSKYLHGIDHLRGLAEALKGHGQVRNEVRISEVLPHPPPSPADSGWPPVNRWSTSSAAASWTTCPCPSTSPTSSRTSGCNCSRNLSGRDVFVLLEQIGGPSARPS